MKRMYDEYFAQDGDDIVENLVEMDDGASSDSDAEEDPETGEMLPAPKVRQGRVLEKARVKGQHVGAGGQ